MQSAIATNAQIAKTNFKNWNRLKQCQPQDKKTNRYQGILMSERCIHCPEIPGHVQSWGKTHGSRLILIHNSSSLLVPLLSIITLDVNLLEVSIRVKFDLGFPTHTLSKRIETDHNPCCRLTVWHRVAAIPYCDQPKPPAFCWNPRHRIIHRPEVLL